MDIDMHMHSLLILIMAMQYQQDRLDFDEQITRIEKMIVEMQSTRQTVQFEPRKFYTLALLASAALLAAGGAVAQALFS